MKIKPARAIDYILDDLIKRENKKILFEKEFLGDLEVMKAWFDDMKRVKKMVIKKEGRNGNN